MILLSHVGNLEVVGVGGIGASCFSDILVSRR